MHPIICVRMKKECGKWKVESFNDHDEALLQALLKMILNHLNQSIEQWTVTL
jgi:hypothetical protein